MTADSLASAVRLDAEPLHPGVGNYSRTCCSEPWSTFAAHSLREGISCPKSVILRCRLHETIEPLCLGERLIATGRSSESCVAAGSLSLKASSPIHLLTLIFTGKRAIGLWPDRMGRNASRAMMVYAGRVTATARADIGATRARREAWVRGCVQACDDDRLRTAIPIGSLLRTRAPGTWPARRLAWQSKVTEGVISCRFCILTLPGST